MLRVSRCAAPIRVLVANRATFATTARAAHQPNAPVDLDPSLKALLRDVDISLARHKSLQSAEDAAGHRHHELEVYPDVGGSQLVDGLRLPQEQEDLDGPDTGATRKSPAAHFGSQRHGAVVLPLELTTRISGLIEGLGEEKHLLHTDAERLFLHRDENGKAGERWDTNLDVRYKSWKQGQRHAERDGTAFATIALPAHFSAVYAVLDHLVHRLGPEWTVERVIDWHAGTGSALWAALTAFQKSEASQLEHPDLTKSTVLSYLGIDKRDGLTAIGKRLVEGANLGETYVSWQKSLHEEDKVRRTHGGDVLAVSAFALSSLPTPLDRKQLVKEMWESGADVIVLVDHNNVGGFESIAAARQQLLRMGSKEVADPETASWPIRGSHVVAPCPHDGACPLYRPGESRVACGFSQRIQRPAFVRKTKHSGVGHEDIGYSYVVVRRGERPAPGEGAAKVGRLGLVGKRELAKQTAARAKVNPQILVEESSNEATVRETGADAVEVVGDAPKSLPAAALADATEDLQAVLRQEAYTWPRLVFPPLKRSGHVILDVCTPQGKIMRHTIPKSQGKQPYYDARKSEWGDIFPHAPKNTPQERFAPAEATGRGGASSRGVKTGKRGADPREAKKQSYGKIAEEVKARKKELRRERARSASEDA